MPQREGSPDYKYEDYSSKMAVNRLPQTTALAGQTMHFTLDSGSTFKLEFLERNKLTWETAGADGADWYEAVEVAPQTYFIDLTFADRPRQSQTFVVNTASRQVLAVRTTLRDGQVGNEPRAMHEFSPGVLGDPIIPPAGRKPGPTRDLIGLRGIYDYGPEHVFEHIYLNSERYAWQCLIGPLRGQADVDHASAYKFDDNQYVFAFREFGLPVSTVFFYNWEQMRSTGKFFAVGEDGATANTPAGAFIRKLSMAFYPLDLQPI